jgi:tetratricopeptide (TPR) repeat protein
MMAMFALLTLYCFARGVESPRSRRWFFAAACASALGMGCKEVMAVVPLLVLLYDRVFLAGSWRELWRRRWRVHLAIFATLLVMGYLQIGAPRSETSHFHSTRLTPWRYLLTEAGVLLYYLRLVVWPSPLVIDYYDWPLATSLRAVWPQACLVAALLVGSVWALVKRPAVGFVGAAFFLVLGPTSSIIPLAGEYASERRMYLPLAAIVPLAVVAVYRLLRRFADAPRTALAGGTLALLAAVPMGRACIQRNEDYQSDLAIWHDAVQKRPNNARAWANYAAVLEGQERYEEAYEAGMVAARIDPTLPRNQRLVAGNLMRRGEYEQAIAHLRMSLKVLDEVMTRRMLAIAYARAGRFDEGFKQFQRAIDADPGHAPTHNEYGFYLAQSGRIEQALEQFETALRLDPDLSDAHFNMALVLGMKGQAKRAGAELRRGMELDPKRPEMMIRLAWMLAVHPALEADGSAEAVDLAEKALGLMREDNPQALDTLAAACARAGRFEEAVKFAQQAHDAAQRARMTALASAIQQREALYRERRPYIQR